MTSVLVVSCMIAPPVMAASGQWPTEGYDLSRRGLSPYNGTGGPGEVWKTSLDDEFGSQLLIGDDGSVFASVRGTVTAIDETGKVRWSNQVSGARNYPINSMTMTDEGDLLVCGSFGALILDHANGLEKWRYQTESWFPEFLWGAFLDDGSMLLAEFYFVSSWSGQYQLHKLSPERTREWTLNTSESVISPAAISSDGTIYIAGHELSAIDAEGHWLWNSSFPFSSSLYTITPILGEDGTIFVVTNFGLFSFASNGSLKWSLGFSTEASFLARCMDVQGNIMVGLKSGEVFDDRNFTTTHHEGPSLLCVSPMGQVLWRQWLPDEPGYGCTCTADGGIYLAAKSSLIVMDENGTLLWRHRYEYISAPPVVSENGTIYVLVTRDKSELLGPRTNVYAIRGEVGPDIPVLEVIIVSFIVIIALVLSIRWIRKRGNAPPDLPGERQ